MAEYKQIKISVDPALAESFRSVCARDGVSVTSELARFMRMRIGEQHPVTVPVSRITTKTRGQRRKATMIVISELETIKDAEEAYMDNIPENLRGGSAREAAEQSVQTLEEAIALLEDVF
jgi:hypothetical protein